MNAEDPLDDNSSSSSLSCGAAAATALSIRHHRRALVSLSLKHSHRFIPVHTGSYRFIQVLICDTNTAPEKQMVLKNAMSWLPRPRETPPSSLHPLPLTTLHPLPHLSSASLDKCKPSVSTRTLSGIPHPDSRSTGSWSDKCRRRSSDE